MDVNTSEWARTGTPHTASTQRRNPAAYHNVAFHIQDPRVLVDNTTLKHKKGIETSASDTARHELAVAIETINVYHLSRVHTTSKALILTFS